MSLTGKVAIVTGGAKGIGYAIAADLARRGAAILIADLEGADAAAKRLRDEGHRATAVKVDVASEADTAAMAKAAPPSSAAPTSSSTTPPSSPRSSASRSRRSIPRRGGA